MTTTTPGPAMRAHLAAAAEAAAAEDAALHDDFDAFWQATGRAGARLRNVFGVDVELPPEPPLRFTQAQERLRSDRSDHATEELTALLFGEATFATWCDAGMDLEQFATMIAWGTENMAGRPTTLPEAHALYLERKAAAESGNRATRRAEGKARTPARRRGSSSPAVGG